MGTSSGEQQPDQLTSIEICAGAGGEAIGLHRAGYRHLALVEYDRHAYQTLENNINAASGWGSCDILHKDVNDFQPAEGLKSLGGRALERGELGLLAGGVPCPPFSVAGQQLGHEDDRDLFPRMLALVDELRPRAVMVENVRGILSGKFDSYRNKIISRLESFGYQFCGWHLLEAHDYGVPQLRPRSVLVAIREEDCRRAGVGPDNFPWPVSKTGRRESVFSALEVSMKHRLDQLIEKYPERAEELIAFHAAWADNSANKRGVAPTLVGGSRKHGGADLGPSRAKAAWGLMGVNATGVADEVRFSESPNRDFLRPPGPMLTVAQAAIIQGFPPEWDFDGGKTAQYRQVGNAFPPAVAEAVGRAIAAVLRPEERDALLQDYKIEHLGAGRSAARGVGSQPSFEDLFPASQIPAQPTSPPHRTDDLVGA